MLNRILAAVLLSGATAHAAVPYQCTHNIPVSAHFYSTAIVAAGGSCALQSSYAYDLAQMLMVKLCSSMQGRYRALSQTVVCDGDETPAKVAEGAAGYIEVSGVCSIEGLTPTCQESTEPVFLGTHHD